MEFFPELLKFNDGSEVVCVKCWEQRRQELLEILQREEYGFVPPLPDRVSGEILEGKKEERDCCSGHAELLHLRISFDAEKDRFLSQCTFLDPQAEKKRL